MMNYRDRTKDQLIKELQKLQKKCDSLKKYYNKDITERKLIEEDLRESEERYRLLFENSGEAILLTNPDGSIYSANPEACRIYGRSEEEICKLGRNCTSDLNDPRLEPALRLRKKTGKFKGELNQVRNDGTIFPAEVSSIVFMDTSGNERTSMIISDISERKEAEKELHVQGEIMKNISEGINLIRKEDEIIVFTNQKFDEIFGYEHGELIGKHVFTLNASTGISPEETKQDIVDTVNRTGEWHGEILNIKKNGDHFWCYVNVSIFDHPDFGKVYLSVHTNINKRKKAEEALQNSEQQYRQLFDQMLNGLLVCEVICDESGIPYDHRFVQGNPAFEQLTGLSLKEQIGRTSKDFGISWPHKISQQLYNIAMQGGSIKYERFNESLGRFYETRVFSPRKGQFAHIFTDITERKQTEEALLLEKENFRNSLDDSPLGVRIATIEGDTIYANKTLLSFYGYESLEELQKSPLKDRYTPESYIEAQKRKHQRELGDFSATEFEISIIRKNGEIRHLQVFRKEIQWTGTKQYQVIYEDITRRKLAEEALRESEARFRNLYENSLIGISTASPDGRLLQANPAYARMYGYESPERMFAEVNNVGKLYANQADREEVLRILNRNGFLEAKEVEVIRRDGSKFFVHVSAREIRDTEGKLLYNQAAQIDLTRQKKSEEKIREASLYARNLIEASLDPLLTISAEGKITDVNSATEQITGVKRAQLIGSYFANYFTDPYKASEGYRIVFSKGLVKDYPLAILHTSGRSTHVLFNATLFKNEAGVVQGVFAAARDITGQMRMEEDLRNSKKLLEDLHNHLNEVRENERASISREIHDQIGQSLTALKLDLNWLHKDINSNPGAVVKLREMIELVSNTIKDIQRISSDLRPGILDDLGLIAAIEWYSDEFQERTGIRCSLKLDHSIIDDSQKNLVFFRVLQEALTNVIRHANASSVTIRLINIPKGTKLTIQDNGVGITREKVESTMSLGLIGMRERVREFGGKIDISSEKRHGTKLTIFIPDK